jgi:hypothetical protein
VTDYSQLDTLVLFCGTKPSTLERNLSIGNAPTPNVSMQVARHAKEGAEARAHFEELDKTVRCAPKLTGWNQKLTDCDSKMTGVYFEDLDKSVAPLRSRVDGSVPQNQDVNLAVVCHPITSTKWYIAPG